MANLLVFDTATHACSVALQVGDLQLADFQVAPRQHSRLLLPTINGLLSQDDLALKALDAIACGIGPGSFMGVRLAVSVAQGLAYASRTPVIGLSTLQILAQTAYEQLGLQRVIAAWDARMDEMYWGAYECHDGVMRAVVDDQLIAPGQWQFNTPGEWVVAGNAWSIYAESLVLPEWVVRDEAAEGLYPVAKSALALAADAYDRGQAVDALQLVPNYVRQQVANKPK